jgi:cyclophilin family peptidyl-prolyl cis-trans isomerase
MSTSAEPLPGQSGRNAEIDQLLEQAEAAAAAEDWEKTIDTYRKLLSFDRVIQGSEAKLQWALRMRDIDTLYKQGKADLEAERYEPALVSLRKARLMFASHYKDTDAMIIQAQTALQKQNWQSRPAQAVGKKGCLIGGTLALVALVSALLLSACASASPSAGGGSAAKLQPQQRSEMYKAPPPMTIDVNKSYVATIKTNKGDIVADLYPKDAPQHVNNFVFLARDGFYNNLTFHRVVPSFVIQGGDPLGTGTGGPGYTVPPEIKGKHTQGALAMARTSGPAATTPSSGSQFYITLEAQPGLDGEYTVFGQVTNGMDVVQKIVQGDTIQTITIDEK